jgi:hypothetical protein
LPQREATARFFFPPSPEIARLLSGLALLEDSPADYGQPCPILAATAIRRRIAAWTLGRADPPSEDELQKLSATCRDEPPRQDLVTSGWQSLFDEIRAEAERVRKKFRRDELEIEQAIGRAYLKHTAELRAAQAEKRASPRGPAIVVR